VTGRKWTALKAERMVNEIGHLVEKHHCNFLTFSDANWGVSQKRVREFCEGLLDKGVEIYWGASVESHILNKFDPEVLKLMKKSGCVNLFIGAESADPNTLKNIQKNIDPGEIFHTCEICSKAGITPTVSYMIGFPDETTESIQSTIEQGCEILYRWPQIELPVLVFLPLPNTPLHDRAVEMGLPPADDIEYWSGYKRFGTELYNPVMRPMPELYSGITQKQLKTLRRCQMYYFWWGCERLKDSKKLTFLEKILNKSSRLRLKYKILGFPIEYKLYYTLLRMLAALRRMK
jgi:hypothetical protein